MTSFTYMKVFTGQNGTSPQTLNLNPIPPNALALIAMGFPSVGPSVTGIAVATAGATGTFIRLNSMNGGGRTGELWLGYNFVGYPSSFVVTWSGGGSCQINETYLIADADLTVAPNVNAATPTAGTSTTLNSGSVTPVLGDLLIAFGIWASATGSSARVSTGNIFAPSTLNEHNANVTNVSMLAGPANVAVASSLQWTIPSVAWLGMALSLTFAAPPAPVPAFVYKGRDTAIADAGTVP